MKPYKGIIKIKCEAAICPRGVRDNVQADCLDCPGAVLAVLDLEGKTISEARITAPDLLVEPAKKPKKGRKK